MRTYAGLGWGSVKDQFYVIILLFVYRLLWGYCLYRLISSIVVPLLLRYPDPAPHELSRLLYFFEGELALTRGGLLPGAVWMLILLAAVHILLTPCIRAGMMYHLHREAEGERGLFLFQGMRKLWKPLTLFYILELILLGLPLYWLLPEALPSFIEAARHPQALLQPGLWVLGWLLYVWIIRLALLYMQFGYTSGTGTPAALLLFLRRLGSALPLSLLIGGLALLSSLLIGGMSLWWSGLIGLLLQQASYFLKSLFQVWGMASQYHVFKSSSTK
ncbi:hypothetical protein JJQ72_18950 [Paenibacillus sp. F411]|uniref:hypothetical protein n=1 Tax=Paenibacillus sp. F411 TaxID=2820239 RepID=UPI001AAE4589|nr:hypothetical protein [Paenibacillus sp. F411]MBO2946059.1 hypothetical protein [Paenibacillus sp. F411]